MEKIEEVYEEKIKTEDSQKCPWCGSIDLKLFYEGETKAGKKYEKYICNNCKKGFRSDNFYDRSLPNCTHCGSWRVRKGGYRMRREKKLKLYHCDYCRKNFVLDEPYKKDEEKVREEIKKTVYQIKCIRCGKDATGKSGSVKYCDDCREIVTKERSKKWHEKNDATVRTVTTECIVCGKDISDRKIGAKYCKEHSPKKGRPFDKKIINEALELHSDGLSINDIIEEIKEKYKLNITYITVWNWIKKGAIREKKITEVIEGQEEKIQEKHAEKEKTQQTPERACIRCGKDISDRRKGAKYCKPCTEDLQREMSREWQRKKREEKESKEKKPMTGNDVLEKYRRRFEKNRKEECKCVQCGHVWEPKVKNPVQCPRCKSKHWKEKEVRKCIECGEDISHRHRLAKYCKTCYKIVNLKRTKGKEKSKEDIEEPDDENKEFEQKFKSTSLPTLSKDALKVKIG